MSREEFERDFNSRTVAYCAEYEADPRPVVVAIGPSAHSKNGHLLAIALINQLARAHRKLIILGDLNRPVECANHFSFDSLEGATAGLATSINPFIEVATGPSTDTNYLIRIGIGTQGDVQLGCRGWHAQVGPFARVDDSATSLMGAILASCLGATAAFQRMMNSPWQLEGIFSLWDYVRRSEKDGPRFEGPIDLGDVLQVGAGAVGCALDYWLRFIGVSGSWTIVDGDRVDVTNLNRQLLFLAKNAGFPSGEPEYKSCVAASTLGAAALGSPAWYGEDPDIVQASYDLVLPLANERGVRTQLQSRAQTVLLHATTTQAWTAIAHRHIAGRDDCIVCRLPEDTEPEFVCSTSSIGTEKQMDASLPFLSSLAGALLLRDLIALQTGVLIDRATNFAAVNLRGAEPFTREYQWTCSDGCRVMMPSSTRLRRTKSQIFHALDGVLENS